MQTSAKLEILESNLARIEKLIAEGEIDEAHHLFQTVFSGIREIFTQEQLESQEDKKKSAKKIYDTLSVLVENTITKKSEVAKSLSSHLNKKKQINAYKNI
jgi:vacuolar-type H+-ATPase catalytic subunit A/Vma1